MSGNFFKAVIQAVLLFGEETWVLNPSMDLSLDSFQNRAARRLTGRQLCRREDRLWEYPPLKEVMRERENGL